MCICQQEKEERSSARQVRTAVECKRLLLPCSSMCCSLPFGRPADSTVMSKCKHVGKRAGQCCLFTYIYECLCLHLFILMLIQRFLYWWTSVLSKWSPTKLLLGIRSLIACIWLLLYVCTVLQGGIQIYHSELLSSLVNLALSSRVLVRGTRLWIEFKS